MARHLAMIRVPRDVSIPAGNITAPEWTGVKGATDVMAALRFDPGHGNYGAVRGAVGASQRIANRQAVQLAADDAASSGGTLVIKGEYEMSGTLTLRCHVDGASGTISTYDATSNPAVMVGSVTSGEMLHNRHLSLPAIIQRAKTGTGWSGSDVGLVVGNAHSCHITIPHVWNFSTGVRFTAKGAGNVYNNVYLGIMENNRVGLDITTEDGTGWTNESAWIGGRFQINSGEGTNIAGAKHIQIRTTTYINNNHLFLKPSIEGNGPAFHLDIDGRYVTVVQGRYEATPPRVRLGANANGTVFDQGYGLPLAQFTVVAGAVNTTVNHREGQRIHAGSTSAVMVLENEAASANAAIAIMDAGSGPTADASAAYGFQTGAQFTRFKAAANPFPRIQVNHANGQISGANGTVDPSANWLQPYGIGGWQVAKKMLALEGIGVGNSVTASTMGTLTRKMQVFDENGNSLGFVPIHAS